VPAVFETPRRHFLKEGEARRLLLDFSREFKVDAERFFGSKPQIELAEAQAAEVLLINEKPILARLRGRLMPTLAFDELLSLLPKIVVDMGAVPHVCNGADVMAPGVVRIHGDFNENGLILVVDERHGKSLAIGIALFNSQTMRSLKRGKVVKNVHYVGDKLWNSLKPLFSVKKV